MGGSVCAEQHKFQPSHQLLSSSKKSLLREIDIPPRKLLTRRHHQEYIPSDIYTTDSPRFSSADEALLRKFLPYNSGADDDDDDPDASDPYSSDHFRMFEFKVRRCTRSRSHDWTDCPFAHPGEKARRRDPRRHHYSGTVCADYRRGCCSRGDSCEFAHGVFECWLHPARYRTEACKDGKNCKRKVCFFAHTPRQLRVLPVQSSRSSSPEVSPVAPSKKYHLNLNSAAAAAVSPNHCCLYCHNCATSSPTSTLLSMSHLSSSPPLSPPLSPAANKHCSSSSSLNGFHSSSSPMSRYSTSSGGGYDQMHAGAGGNMMTYKDVLAELMSSLEAMKVDDQTSSAPNIVSPINRSSNVPNWVDVSSFNAAAADQDHQQQFILSPSSIPSPCGNYFSTTGDCSSRKSLFNIDHHEKLMNDINGAGSSSSPDPDLGWVNDLLM